MGGYGTARRRSRFSQGNEAFRMRPYPPSFIPPEKPQDVISRSTPRQDRPCFSARAHDTQRRRRWISKRQSTSLISFTRDPLRLASIERVGRNVRLSMLIKSATTSPSPDALFSD